MIPKKDSVDALGTQLLGLALITVLVIIVTWVFFFPLKSLGKLRVRKSVEVLGRDALMNAESKGLELELVMDEIEKRYPPPKKRGC